MSIELAAAEVYALADRLQAAADEADDAGALLVAPAGIGGPLRPAVEAFLQCHCTAIGAMAGELRWLGSTVAAVADSWLTLDAVVMGRARASLE